MINQAQALISWLSAHVLTTYQEPVPQNAALPYISFGFVQPEAFGAVIQPMRIWTKADNNYAKVYAYVDTLEAALGESGVLLDGAGCKLWIKKGSPFVQNYDDGEKNSRAVLINLEISYYY